MNSEPPFIEVMLLVDKKLVMHTFYTNDYLPFDSKNMRLIDKKKSLLAHVESYVELEKLNKVGQVEVRVRDAEASHRVELDLTPYEDYMIRYKK